MRIYSPLSATDFATVMNPWLLNVINLKANGGINDAGIHVESEPSPMGLVFFNQCTNSTYKGPEIIKAIVEMNNKFELLRAGADGGGTGDGPMGE